MDCFVAVLLAMTKPRRRGPETANLPTRFAAENVMPQHVHFIGIAGIGMSATALLMRMQLSLIHI